MDITEQELREYAPSIPILRVGVQLDYLLFSHYFAYLQFPYCAWEFNVIVLRGEACLFAFNSHTARGSSIILKPAVFAGRSPSIPILRVGVQ